MLVPTIIYEGNTLVKMLMNMYLRLEMGCVMLKRKYFHFRCLSGRIGKFGL
ncbi:hypothetical protein SBF1_630005 [Candidatus Desulfosporosinus infrequens]|uniref:Uncharacterized protein n=1 Tax=Candidatus Desulfosporosinus infrequens TaxID=2043169 RepID=A0A2U3LMC2_9FIRM|nr:hypothetical protein SBF1_630005 [Candidatus Desulfosporosinus infrequens]